jgi:hypothetical protein
LLGEQQRAVKAAHDGQRERKAGKPVVTLGGHAKDLRIGGSALVQVPESLVNIGLRLMQLKQFFALTKSSSGMGIRWQDAQPSLCLWPP